MPLIQCRTEGKLIPGLVDLYERETLVPVSEGYLYARPLGESEAEPLKAIEPHFLGAIIHAIRPLPSKIDKKYSDLDIENDTEFMEEWSDAYYAWIRAGWPYAESGFLWQDREHCRPPLAVAEAAERFADALQAGETEAVRFYPMANFHLQQPLEELAAGCIQALRDLAKACRYAAEKGATEVTLFTQM